MRVVVVAVVDGVFNAVVLVGFDMIVVVMVVMVVVVVVVMVVIVVVVMLLLLLLLVVEVVVCNAFKMPSIFWTPFSHSASLS